MKKNTLYLGTSDTHEVKVIVNGAHTIEEIIELVSPYTEGLEIEEVEIKEDSPLFDELKESPYNVIASFAPYGSSSPFDIPLFPFQMRFITKSYAIKAYTMMKNYERIIHFSPKSYKKENYRYTFNKDENPFFELTKSVMKVDYTDR